MNLINKVKSDAEACAEEIIAIRRHLHAHPELSFEEVNTAAYISQLLNKWDIPHETGVGGNGIVGLIEGKNPSKKVIALRADMDALPINELNNCSYRSTNDGVMHACGHDVHMSCLLGAAKILNTMKMKIQFSRSFKPAQV